MRNNGIRSAAVLLTLCLLLCACGAPAEQAEPTAGPETGEESAAAAALRETADYLLEKVPQPQTGSLGGEWTVIGMARSGADVPPGYFDAYYDSVVQFVRERGGVLHQRKYTEYSRVILGLTAIGKDPADVGGYDLLRPLGDYEQTVWQGINGPVWALIALDSGAYDIPENPDAPVQATRDAYIACILDEQLDDGGWALTGGASDADLTAMALQALCGYSGQPEVKAAIDRALERLSALQSESGGFSSWGEESAESCAQAIVALTGLGIDLNDSRFVKNGRNALDALLDFRTPEGGFRHTAAAGADLMATEQAFYALAAACRAETGKSRLYDMRDPRG
ncbi:MAG: terpene cyclase/mutase family protein [Clostridia bacterium]|nr:terpene cyclase/mutase family protein [Clostridia bacterium]